MTGIWWVCAHYLSSLNAAAVCIILLSYDILPDRKYLVVLQLEGRRTGRICTLHPTTAAHIGSIDIIFPGWSLALSTDVLVKYTWYLVGAILLSTSWCMYHMVLFTGNSYSMLYTKYTYFTAAAELYLVCTIDVTQTRLWPLKVSLWPFLPGSSTLSTTTFCSRLHVQYVALICVESFWDFQRKRAAKNKIVTITASATLGSLWATG